MQETQEIQIWFLGQEDPLEKEIANYSSPLACEIPWTKEPVSLTVCSVTKSQTPLGSWAHMSTSYSQSSVLSREKL